MFDKKQKSCVKRIHLVTDDGLYDRKGFYTVKIVFYLSSCPPCSSSSVKKICKISSIFLGSTFYISGTSPLCFTQV